MKNIIVWLLGALLLQPVLAQENLIFRRIKVEDGLSQSSVNCMLQDKLGYLWFGTANGLNRYDGYSFKVFFNNPSDSTTISDNGILSLFEDSKGFIWIGTVGGVLNKYDRRTGIFKHYNFVANLDTDADEQETFFEYPIPYSRSNDRSVTSIAEDKNGNIWFGTWGKGLIKLNPTTHKAEHFRFEKDKPTLFHSNRIKAIRVDKEGRIWVGTLGSGLFRFNEKGTLTELSNFQHNISDKNSLSSNHVMSLTLDSFGNLWIGTYGGGLNFLSAKEQQKNSLNAKFIKYQQNVLPNAIVTSIIEDSEYQIWIGTFGGGIVKHNPQRKTFTNFKNNPRDETTISKDEIMSLLQDRSGSLWVGTHLGKGVNKLEKKKEKFNQISKNLSSFGAGLNDDIVWSIYADDRENVWIGTFAGGLNLWNRRTNKFTYLTKQNGLLSDNHVRAITQDNYGNMLIGTYSGGLNIYNNQTKTSRVFKNISGDSTSLGANQVQSIYIDREGNWWIGTFGGGLNKLNKADAVRGNFVFKQYKANIIKPNRISDNRVYSIYEDSEGFLWIGTFGGGLNKFDKKTEKFFSYKNNPADKNSLSDNRVMSVYEDSNKNLWIGTYGGGLNRFDKTKEKFERYNDNTRLKSSVVYGVLEDNFNHLWMSTDNGLYKFDLPTKQFTQYDQNDGLQSLEFSGGAFCKSKFGEMFFGGITGVNYFFPDKVIDNNFIPPIVISSIRIFDEQLREERDTISLTYDQNFFSFEFAALDFTNANDNQYAYMLEGFDHQWRFVDSRRRTAFYTNLSPGNYVFSVIGSNNDGVWNYNGKNIYITILPPFYKRWWFIAAVVLSALGIAYYIITARYKNLLAIEKLKGKLAADLHDNVGSGLTEISILSELTAYQAQNLSMDVSHNLNTISEKARHLIDNMSDIVWMVNPQRDSFYDLIVRLKDSYSDLMMASGISFKTTNLEKLNTVRLPMEIKQNLFLIFKEALNNAIKHSKCKKISLDAEVSQNILVLSIKDDGSGIESSRFNAGNGIRNMQSRAKAIGGDLNILSSADGTTLTFSGKFITSNKFPFLPV